jgi:hypothetical protein
VRCCNRVIGCESSKCAEPATRVSPKISGLTVRFNRSAPQRLESSDCDRNSKQRALTQYGSLFEPSCVELALGPALNIASAIQLESAHSLSITAISYLSEATFSRLKSEFHTGIQLICTGPRLFSSPLLIFGSSARISASTPWLRVLPLVPTCVYQSPSRNAIYPLSSPLYPIVPGAQRAYHARSVSQYHHDQLSPTKPQSRELGDGSCRGSPICI